MITVNKKKLIVWKPLWGPKPGSVGRVQNVKNPDVNVGAFR